MKIPNTTKNLPYIEFRIYKNGRVKLSATSAWWGGKTAGFISSDGSEGNACKPGELKSYFKAFKERKVKSIEEDITSLQNKLEKIKSAAEKWGI